LIFATSGANNSITFLEFQVQITVEWIIDVASSIQLTIAGYTMLELLTRSISHNVGANYCISPLRLYITVKWVNAFASMRWLLTVDFRLVDAMRLFLFLLLLAQ
jgi:hypothetical protein